MLQEICKLLSLLSLVRYLFARDVHDATIGFFDFSSGSSRADLYQSARLIRLQAPCQIRKPQTGMKPQTGARSFGAAWCKRRTKNLRSVLHQAAPKLLKQQRYGLYYNKGLGSGFRPSRMRQKRGAQGRKRHSNLYLLALIHLLKECVFICQKPALKSLNRNSARYKTRTHTI